MNKSLEELRELLKKKLPGSAAQLKMAPKGRELELSNSLQRIITATQSAVMVLLFSENNRLQIVFIQRSIYDGHHSGQIAFPGGKTEKHDANYLATALRETTEEIGIKAESIEVIGQLTDLFIPPSNYLVKVFVGLCKSAPSFIIDSHEVQSVICVDFDDLLDETNLHSKAFFASTLNPTIAPYFLVQNKEIWGATAMIVAELIDIIQN